MRKLSMFLVMSLNPLSYVLIYPNMFKSNKKRTMKTTILSLALLLLASCQDNKKEQLLHLVKEWQGKEIRFPEKPVFTRFVTDTTDYRIRM